MGNKNVYLCSCGHRSVNSKLFFDNNRLYLCITDFPHDVSLYEKADIIRELVSLGIVNPSPKLAGSLISFCKKVNVGDYVIFGVRFSHFKTFVLCKVVGDYEYLEGETLCHSRKMKIIIKDIPLAIFADRSKSRLKVSIFRRILNPYEIIITIKHYAEFLFKEGRIDKATFDEVKSIDISVTNSNT